MSEHTDTGSIAQTLSNNDALAADTQWRVLVDKAALKLDDACTPAALADEFGTPPHHADEICNEAAMVALGADRDQITLADFRDAAATVDADDVPQGDETATDTPSPATSSLHAEVADLRATVENIETILNRDIPLLKGTLLLLFDDEDTDGIEDLPDAAREFAARLDDIDARVTDLAETLADSDETEVSDDV